MHYSILNLIIATAVVGAQRPSPPPQPLQYPPNERIDGTFITGDFLKDPLVVSAYDYVKSVAPGNLLAIAPSKFNNGANVTYSASVCTETSCPDPTCYWPYNLCTRNADAAGFKADISTCPGTAWGLTFDDGPTVQTDGSADTPKLVAALADAKLKASFFVVGARVLKNPSALKAVFDGAHEIGIHTWTHNPLTSMTNEQIVAEIVYTEAIIHKTIGLLPNVFRPPYGDLDDRVRAILSALGYRIAYWTTTPSRDTNDAVNSLNPALSTPAGQKAIVDLVTSWFNTTTGFISLEHDLNPFCINAAIQILSGIKNNAGVASRIKTVAACAGYPAAKVVGTGDAGIGNATTPGGGTNKSGASSAGYIATIVATVGILFLLLE